MIKILDETEKRLIVEVEATYNNYCCIVETTGSDDTMCRLIAVSDDSRDEKELSDLCWDYNDSKDGVYYMIVGSYNNDALYIQHTLSGGSDEGVK